MLNDDGNDMKELSSEYKYLGTKTSQNWEVNTGDQISLLIFCLMTLPVTQTIYRRMLDGRTEEIYEKIESG
jgi:hypothetical protein